MLLFKNFKKNLFYYLEIIKLRIIFANLFSATAGYFFSLQKKYFNKIEFFFMIIGLFFIISCSCVLNNIFDKKNDKKMLRTKNRVLVKKKISIRSAFLYSFILFFLGSCILISYCNIIIYLISLFGLIIYVFLYTIILKNTSQYSTFFGSISGACPILIGYFLNTYDLSLQCIILFLIFFVWQIPHSYSISLLYFQDYCIAKIPVFPIINKINKTIDNMYFYVNLLIIFTFLLGILNHFNYFYFFSFFLLAVFWLLIIIQGYCKFLKRLEWSLKMFQISIFYIFFFNCSLLLNKSIF